MSDINNLLITGAKSKVGIAVANEFKNAGWNVIEFGEKNNVDIANRDDVKKEIALIEKGGTCIDAVFHISTKQVDTKFEDTPIEEWQELLHNWLGGTANICSAVAPYMIKRKEGKIMIFSPDYSAVKGDCILNATASGTLHGFVKSFGVEVAPHNVLVNALWAGQPFDLSSIASTAYYFATIDTYTTAQVVSIKGGSV